MGGLTIPLKTSVSGAGAGSAKRTTPSASTSPAKWPVSHSILIWPSLWGGIVPAKRAAMPPLPAPPVLEEIEPKLGELESLVVELPEEVLEAAREERDALEDPVAVDIGHERAQLVGDVLEGGLARVPDEQHVLGRAHGLERGRVCRAGGHRGLAPGLSQAASPDFVGRRLARGARDQRRDVRVARKLEGRSLAGDPGAGTVER